MIPAATTILHAEPAHTCAGCRNLATRRCTPMGCDLARQHSWCLLHVTPFARCALYETPPAGKPSHLSSLMTR